MEDNSNIPKSIEIMRRISSKEFSDYFYKNMFPKLIEYEKQRKKAVLFSKISTIIFLFCGCFFIICLGLYLNVLQLYLDALSVVFIMTGIAFIFCLICMFYSFMPQKKTMHRDMKVELLPDLLNFAGSDFKINVYENNCINFSDRMRFLNQTIEGTDIVEFRNLPIFQDIKRLTGLTVDDYVTGKYNSVPIVIIDVQILHKNYGAFNGLIVKIPVNKKFTTHIYINKQKSSADIIFDPSQGEKIYRGIPIHLEDPVFEKYFDVYADDQVEARYILTTGFMNRLVSIAAKNKKCSVSCSFIDGYMYLALDGKDWFDIPSSKRRFYRRVQNHR